jgi:hypothetical protein
LEEALDLSSDRILNGLMKFLQEQYSVRIFEFPRQYHSTIAPYTFTDSFITDAV